VFHRAHRIAKWLLDDGNLCGKESASEKTLLHMAAKYGLVSSMHMLLGAGLQFPAENKYFAREGISSFLDMKSTTCAHSGTAIEYADAAGHKEIVQLLATSGANVPKKLVKKWEKQKKKAEAEAKAAAQKRKAERKDNMPWGQRMALRSVLYVATSGASEMCGMGSMVGLKGVWFGVFPHG
jgi:hypothetical protein